MEIGAVAAERAVKSESWWWKIMITAATAAPTPRRRRRLRQSSSFSRGQSGRTVTTLVRCWKLLRARRNGCGAGSKDGLWRRGSCLGRQELNVTITLRRRRTVRVLFWFRCRYSGIRLEWKLSLHCFRVNKIILSHYNAGVANEELVLRALDFGESG